MAREVKKSQRELLGILHKYGFTSKAVDPEGDDLQLIFDWGDGSAVTRSELVASGQELEVEHAWGSEGDYRIRCQAVDKNGYRSAWSEFARISIREKNHPPTVPEILRIPTEVASNEKIPVVVRSQDPDGQGKRVNYYFHVGGPDLTPDEKDFVKFDGPPGEETTAVLPSTGESGEYWIRVRAQDEQGAASDWSEPRTVLAIKDRNPYVRPQFDSVPSTVAVGREFVVRARVPLGPRCRIEFMFGEKADKSSWASDPVEPGTIVEAKTSPKIPPEDPKGFRVWMRTVDPASPGRTSDWRKTRILTTRGNLAPAVPSRPTGPNKGRLTRPIWRQYLTWLGKCGTLDFGQSTSLKEDIVVLRKKRFLGVNWPVGIAGGVLPPRLMRTIKLESIALFLIYLIAVPIGIYSSTHHRSLLDKAITFVLFVLYSLPSFWVGTMLIVFVGSLSLHPNASISTFFRGIPFDHLSCLEPHKHPFLGGKLDFFWHAILPVACLTYGGLAALSRYARSGMLEVVRQDYIRTARAKGLSERMVILKHGLRNGMIPILTLLANLLPYLIGGAIIIEYIFSIDGMGLLAYEAITQRDYNVVMAVTTLSAVLTLLGILLSDILYVLVDPRISFEAQEGA